MQRVVIIDPQRQAILEDFLGQERIDVEGPAGVMQKVALPVHHLFAANDVCPLKENNLLKRLGFQELRSEEESRYGCSRAIVVGRPWN